MMWNKRFAVPSAIAVTAIGWAALLLAQQAQHPQKSPPAAAAAAIPRDAAPDNVLSHDQWQRVDESAERALAWLASQQQLDGSFATDQFGQPGVTGLVTLAYLAWGHEPGSGRYGATIDRALGYIASCQRVNGFISAEGPDEPVVAGAARQTYSVPATYNHAIAGLTLSEAYGISGAHAGAETARAIERALQVSLAIQSWDRSPENAGGWRYLHTRDSDLSVAGWHLMFLRSAKNAGFDVPDEPIDRAVGFVLRCFSPEFKTFEYDVKPEDRRSRAMAGAGILALAHSGMHNRPEARAAADWILAHGFGNYNEAQQFGTTYHGDRYHYGVFYCSQAMYQMGGHYWQQFFPATVPVLLANQRLDGSWAEESNQDMRFGRTYTTALVVLALGAPNQILPIFQR
jgi:hypothetical protein